MANFDFPVPYTTTLRFNEKPRKYNVLGNLAVDVEEISMSDLTPVASWQARCPGDSWPMGPAGECYWHKDRFLSPILVAPFARAEDEVLPLRLADVRRRMLSRDRVFTYDEAFFRNSQPSGYEHELFKETMANDSWRPENLPNGERVEDTFHQKANTAKDFAHNIVLVDDALFHVTQEPVLGCIFNSECDAVVFRIRTADRLHEDFELFRLDRLDDAIAYAETRWPGKQISFSDVKPTIHDDSHLSFDDEGFSLIYSARSVLDEVLTSLSNLPKEVGMDIVRLNKLVPKIEFCTPDLPDAETLEDIANRLPTVKAALKPYEKLRVDAAVERWNLRPRTATFGLR